MAAVGCRAQVAQRAVVGRQGVGMVLCRGLDLDPGFFPHRAPGACLCVVVSIFVFRAVLHEEVRCLRTSQLL